MNYDNLPSNSETIANDNQVFHIYSDIKRVCLIPLTLTRSSSNSEQLMPCSLDHFHYAPMMDIAGTVFNSDKDQLCFDINAEQYLSFYKFHCV
jgi:hypothetical protein